MKKLLILGAILTISSSYACDAPLINFEFECSIQDRYRKVKYELRDNFNVNVDQISKYRTLRFISERSYQKNIDKGFFRPDFIYEPAPKTWYKWEDGDKFSQTIDWRERVTISQIRELHKSSITYGMMSKWSTIFKGSRPGKIRTRSTQIAPGFKVKCEDKTPLSDFLFTKNYDLQDNKGNNLLRLLRGKYKQCKNKKYYSGTFMYLKSKLVPGALKEWELHLHSFQDELNEPYNKNSLSPVERIADLQRRFVSIHPFGDGNGRTSRFIQDGLLRGIDLPTPFNSDLRNDLFTKTNDYREMMKESIKRSLSFLESCLDEYKNKKVSLECKDLAK